MSRLVDAAADGWCFVLAARGHAIFEWLVRAATASGVQDA